MRVIHIFRPRNFATVWDGRQRRILPALGKDDIRRIVHGIEKRDGKTLGRYQFKL